MESLQDPVSMLIDKPFSSLADTDKKNIMTSGRPQPVLHLSKVIKSGTNYFTRSFKYSWYEEYPWLCGSEVMQALFCWWCLTMSGANHTWCKVGFKDVGNSQRAFKNHQETAEHLRFALKFKFLQNYAATKNNTQKHNETIRLNRRVLAILFKVAIVLARQELPFSEHSEKERNFKKILQEWFAEGALKVTKQFKKLQPTFSCDSKMVQNCLLQCIAEYVRKYVLEEIAGACFFSLQVDDTTGNGQLPKCSIVLRYVNNDRQLVERLLWLYDAGADKKAEGLFNLLHGVLKPLRYEERLVAQCYDGASVMTGELNGLQKRIKEAAPSAMFVHCMAYRLNLVLEQAASQTKEIRIFFSYLSSFLTYFHESPRRTALWNRIIGKKLPTIAKTRRASHSKLLAMLATNYKKITEMLTAIKEDPRTDLSSFSKAHGFVTTMTSFRFAFMLMTFAKLFSITRPLGQVLRKKYLEVRYCLTRLFISQAMLTKLLTSKVAKEVYEKARKLTSSSDRKFDKLSEEDIFPEHQKLFFETVETVKVQLNDHFKDMQKLEFLELVDSSKYCKFSENFPNEALENLCEYYGRFFRPRVLKTQLEIFYADSNYRRLGIQATVVKMKENAIHDIFSEVYKLFCLVLTLPSTRATVERRFSCLKRIKTVATAINTISEETLAAIYIQQDLISDLWEKKNSDFFESLISIYDQLQHQK